MITDDVTRLGKENQLLTNQVRRLVQTEAMLQASQERLAAQASIYRRLYEVGKQFNSVLTVEQILAVIPSFARYDLGFERCMALWHTRPDEPYAVWALAGYYMDGGRPAPELQQHAPALQPLADGAESILCEEGCEQAELLALGRALDLDEFAIFPLRTAGESDGLVIAGNTLGHVNDQNQIHPASDAVLGLANLASLAASALQNVLSYQALQEERQLLEVRVQERTRELDRARYAADQANSAKSAFLASMSHEIRTPLNAIIGYSEMLQETAEDEGHDAYIADLQKIVSAGKHLLGLINDVLDISKIEAGKMSLYLERFGVAAMIYDVSAMITPLMSKNGNTLAIHCDPAIATMTADLTKVRQAVFNLLSNAAKFTRGGAVTLEATRDMIDGAAWITFAISDTGIGMSEAQLGSLFQEFAQADAATTRNYGGTGLGLVLSRRLCRMMGGDITVRSAPGQGSTFTIHLPAEVVDPGAGSATRGDDA
jgi:signal transduction histidine kinase